MIILVIIVCKTIIRMTKMERINERMVQEMTNYKGYLMKMFCVGRDIFGLFKKRYKYQSLKIG